ncbi:MAG TPA: PBP1A family penicillin-binding protein [Spirochaetes bacterium]|nr:PBP1A family penicillin-binding protein [Spirochaetota bacterium]
MNVHHRKILAAVFAAFLIAPGAYFLFIYHRSYALLTSIEHYNPSLSTRLYDVNGELISELFQENRDYIAIEQVPPGVVQAFLSAEDRNFYAHRGFDISSILRALMVDILTGEIRQGGSTITQQLVKQVYTGSERSVRRKIIELLLAREMERRYDKDAILEMYLNQIYFGHGVYGVKSAARFFFNLDISRLTSAHGAVLAAIPSAPMKYSPLRNPSLCMHLSRNIFAAIPAVFKKDLSGENVDFASFWAGFLDEIRTLPPTLSSRSRRFDRAPYFTEHVRRILIARYGEKKVYNGGLKVYTTLDLRCQIEAQEIMNAALKKQNRVASWSNQYRLRNIDRIILGAGLSRRGAPEMRQGAEFLRHTRASSFEECEILSLLCGADGAFNAFRSYMDRYESIIESSRVEGALVALVPSTGEIVSMIGGSSFEGANQLNRAVQAMRQPGSAFKPFLYGAAIELKRISAASSFLDAPIINNEPGKKWSPTNYDSRFHGAVLVRKALAISLNTIPVLVYDTIGSRPVARFASRLMDIPLSRFELDPTLALGTTELTPLEITRGFAVFANDGMAVHPHAIRKVTDSSDRTLYEFAPASASRRLVSAETAYIMTSLLRGVVDHGTGYSAVRRYAGFHDPAAGKTGTNTEFRDAWFVGYVPGLAACVWIGCDSQKFTLGSGQSGSVVAAPAWGEFMRNTRKYRKAGYFPGPPRGIITVRICLKTGLLPGPDCPARREYFIPGTEPRDACDGIHEEMESVGQLMRKDRDTNGR